MYELPLPDIFNLENQILNLNVTDYLTGNKYPFITVSMPDISNLTFTPTDKQYVGDHIV